MPSVVVVPPPPPVVDVVEPSVVEVESSGICHDPSSPYYSRTTHFTPYETLDACLKAGGRLPK